MHNEADDMELVQKCVFPLGVCVTILGVFYLTTQGQPKRIQDDDDISVLDGHHSARGHRGDHDRKPLAHSNPSTSTRSPSPSPTLSTAKSVDDRDVVGGSIRSKAMALSVAADDMDVNLDPEDDEESLSAPFDPTVTPLIAPPLSSKMSPAVDSMKESTERNEHGLIGLIKNLGDIERASIVGGASLGVLLVDPDGCFKDIHLGGNEEDTYFKDILSPHLDAVNAGNAPDITAALRQHLAAPQQASRYRAVRRTRSHSLHRDVLSEAEAERVRRHSGNRRRRREAQRMRSRSHSPNPRFSVTEMAPHEVVWERFTSMFQRQHQGPKKALFTSDRDRGYASLEEAVSSEQILTGTDNEEDEEDDNVVSNAEEQ